MLGTRWVYDATGDPVWRATLAETILTGGTGAEEYFEVDGRRETREPSVEVAGSGATTGADPPTSRSSSSAGWARRSRRTPCSPEPGTAAPGCSPRVRTGG